MLRPIMSFCLALLSGALLLASPARADSQVSRAPGAFLPVQYHYDYGGPREDWSERTCCRRHERGGYRIFWTTVGECYQTRGERTTNKECRKSGGFHPYPGGYWGGYPGGYPGGGYPGGYPGGGWNDGNWNERWCCARDSHVWWSTKGECLRSGGYQAANRVCRRR